MSQQISEQAQQLWKTVSEPETAKTYRSFFALSWKILRDAGRLLWLTLCFGLVAVDWMRRMSIRLRQQVRQWIAWLQGVESENLAKEAKTVLLLASQKTLKGALVAARQELGLADVAEPLMLAEEEAESTEAEAEGDVSADVSAAKGLSEVEV